MNIFFIIYSWSLAIRYCGWNFIGGKIEELDRLFELYSG